LCVLLAFALCFPFLLASNFIAILASTLSTFAFNSLGSPPPQSSIRFFATHEFSFIYALVQLWRSLHSLFSFMPPFGPCSHIYSPTSHSTCILRLHFPFIFNRSFLVRKFAPRGLTIGLDSSWIIYGVVCLVLVEFMEKSMAVNWEFDCLVKTTWLSIGSRGNGDAVQRKLWNTSNGTCVHAFMNQRQEDAAGRFFFRTCSIVTAGPPPAPVDSPPG